MPKMHKMKTSRVFVNEKSEYGNPVGIVIDEGKKNLAFLLVKGDK